MAYKTVRQSFDVEFYLERYEDVRSAHSRGEIPDVVLHYLRFGWREGRDPHPGFSTKEYLSLNPDVARSGLNPYYHYLRFGRSEGRRANIDTVESSASQLAAPPVNSDGRTEWVGYETLRSDMSGSASSGEPDLNAIGFRKSLRNRSLVDEVSRLSFPTPRDDADLVLSVVIDAGSPAIDTANCLAAFGASALDAGTYEVILFADPANDTADVDYSALANMAYVAGPAGADFGQTRNLAAGQAKGRFLLFLSRQAQVAPDATAALLHAITAAPDEVGIVGPKWLSPDGRLGAAGCYVHEDGRGEAIGAGSDHREPRFNYQRAVQYVPADGLMIARADFETLGGFDSELGAGDLAAADLCLRMRGHGRKVLYVPEAVALRQSAVDDPATSTESKSRRSAANRQRFIEHWQETLSVRDLRTIAFYLPQYHPIYENDRAWGVGFTEWRNVARARPNYEGHRQPRVPADLGYYDLRLVETMEAQAALAARYGISAFCYYYYWFDGKRLLQRPLETMLELGRPNFPFCLAWANEHWTRRWDGREDHVIVAQKYSDENDLAIIADLARYLGSPQYLRVDGRPLLLIYRAQDLPDFRKTADVWRSYCLDVGIGDIALALVETFDLAHRPQHPATFGCDFAVDFPPHKITDEPMAVEMSNESFTGSVHDYTHLARSYSQWAEPAFERLRSVLVGWDNTPRRQDDSVVLENGSPGAFQAWLEWTIRRTREQNEGDSKIVFLNAWNEWCEGAYLEPDLELGHSYLRAVHNALSADQ